MLLFTSVSEFHDTTTNQVIQTAFVVDKSETVFADPLPWSYNFLVLIDKRKSFFDPIFHLIVIESSTLEHFIYYLAVEL